MRVAARADRPQIAVVELGAWDVFDNTIDGVTLRFSTPASDAYFTRQLDKGVDLLVAAGAQVALMGVPCYRPIAAGGLPKLPERGDDRRTRHVTALLKAEARTHPERVFMIYPPRQFCTDPSVATNTAYRWDGVHYYRPGAALTFQVITPQLLEIPSLRCADGSRPTWRRNRSTAAGWICRKPDGHGRAGPRPSVTRH